MKISKRENVALQRRLVTIFKEILDDAEDQFGETLHDELQPYLEDDDEIMDIIEVYYWDAINSAYDEKGGSPK